MKKLIKYIALKRKEKEIQGKMEILKADALADAINAGSKGSIDDAGFTVKVTKGKYSFPTDDDALNTIAHLIAAKEMEINEIAHDLQGQLLLLREQFEARQNELITEGKAIKDEDKKTLEIRFKQ